MDKTYELLENHATQGSLSTRSSLATFAMQELKNAIITEAQEVSITMKTGQLHLTFDPGSKRSKQAAETHNSAVLCSEKKNRKKNWINLRHCSNVLLYKNIERKLRKTQ